MGIQIIQYAKKNLEPGEKILYQTRTHWIVLLTPVLYLMIAATVHAWARYHGVHGLPGNDLKAIPGLIVNNVDDTLPLITIFLASSAVSGYFALVGLVMLITRTVALITSEMTVTTRRVIDKDGLFWRDANEISARQLEGSRLVAQSWLGQLLDYGTLEVNGVGGKVIRLPFATSPLTLRRYVARLIAAYERRNSKPSS